MKFPELTKRNQILLLGLIVLLIPAFFVYGYTQNDPRFCTSCHLMNSAYDTWSVSAMHDLNCHKCHETDMVTSINHVVDVITKNPTEVKKEVEIDNSLCENCHINDDPKWLQIADTAGHKVHMYGGVGNADCIDCHGTRLHIFRPPEEICIQCHDVKKSIAETLMGTHCATCHKYTVTDTELFPTDSTCLKCHNNKDNMGKTFPGEAHDYLLCTDCHNPHEENPYPDCLSCHNKGDGLHNLPEHNNCVSCHIPHNDNGLRDNCIICHSDKQNHFTPLKCSLCHRF